MKQNSFLQVVRNAMTTRAAWLSRLLDPRKDIEKECGHPEDISIDDYTRLFHRGDLASRVVSLFPEESWNEDPTIYETEDSNETEFEKAWKELEKRHQALSFLQRVDLLSGIGRYGVLLIGLDDGLDLKDPVEGVGEDGMPVGKPKERKVIYLRAFDEKLVTINRLEGNPMSPRYGLPVEYQIHFVDTTTILQGDNTSSRADSTAKVVHWTRVIHVADNRTSSEIFGMPRMQKVFNRLLDLRKVAGGSGEMFWKGGFPGYSLETHPGEMEDVEIDTEATKEQMAQYMNGLQRYIATVGMNVKSLSVQIADPNPHAEMQIRLVAMALGVPWRVLMGAETGQLASGQDMLSWAKRIDRRRKAYVTPFIIQPFVERLIVFGVLPALGEDGLQVDWPAVDEPSEEAKATVSEKRTNALAKYVQSGADMMMPPFHYLTLVLGMEEDEANSIIEAAEERIAETEEEEEEEEVTGGPVPPNMEEEEEEEAEEA